jgi:ATP-dependent DNA helicase DinG
MNAPQPDKQPPPRQDIALPIIPALAVNAREACFLSAEGEIQTLSHDRVQMLVHDKAVLVCHAPYTKGRLGTQEFYAFDVLELFAFVHPAKFCVPTPQGLCAVLGLKAPQTLEDVPGSLFDITRALLGDLQNDPYAQKASPLEIAGVMGLQGKGWPWTRFVFSALGQAYNESEIVHSKTALNVWRHLPEWAEDAPVPPPAHHAVTGDEARARLDMLTGHASEKRTEQIDYATHITPAFAPVQDKDFPNVVLAEAGTGVGKTLGYLAPASVWAEKNAGTVWISTYTKNLQRQIDQELDKLYPNPELKEIHTAIRKGRENYLCLLNLDETAAGASLAKSPQQAISAGIMARWAAATKDGDLSGADFPGWLAGILGYAHTLGLADRRGECIYSACDHYHKCFVEKSLRKAKRARIVIANHALVMIGTALSSPGEDMPGRYIFDEGHHLFEAADSAFAAHLSAQETRDLRRWLLGAESRRRSRARGLRRRAEELTEGDAQAAKALEDILEAAQCLPTDGWAKRLKDKIPSGTAEEFMALLHQQIFARADGRDGPYSLETPTHPLNDDVLDKAQALQKKLAALQQPMQALARIFRKKLADDQGMLGADTRRRLEAVSVALERRSMLMLQAWIGMLETLKDGKTPARFVDWMEIEREGGRMIDVGLYRHHVDPMKPFAASVKPHLHGMAITSATLRDDSENWDTAIRRTGVEYLTPDAHKVGFDSPFDYAAQTRIFIINDVRKDDLGQVAGAYRALFEAAGGGGLGLFTAIQRLRAVHEKIALPLEEKGIALYSQHVDEIDPGTLVDMFREDVHACLLGTDAVRDGVDVPGESLRLIVFDRVPWPRPTILHKARREAFGGRGYDEMLTRLKLKQAFGRLIRRKGDKGVFVMLDPMLPTRLQNAFPPGAPVVKTGLSEAVAGIKDFLA